MAAFSIGFGSNPSFDPGFGGDTADNVNAAVSTGLQIFNTIQQSRLLQSQIDHAQTPSIVGVPGAPSGVLAPALTSVARIGGNITGGTWVLIGLAVLALVFVFKR